VEEQQHLALLVRKTHERLPKGRSNPIVLLIARRGLVRRDILSHVTQHSLRVVHRPALLEVVQQQASGDREKPSREPVSPVEPVEIRQRSNERFLGDVLRDVPLAAHAQQESEKGVLVCANQLLGGGAIARGSPSDQLGLIEGWLHNGTQHPQDTPLYHPPKHGLRHVTKKIFRLRKRRRGPPIGEPHTHAFDI
jgi:hypothetical protein